MLRPRHIVTIVDKFSVPTYISHTEFSLRRIGVDAPHYVLNYVADGDVIMLGDSKISVHETPGHTLGSVCYQTDKALITGDTLFINGCGRCDFRDSDIDAMWDSLQRLKSLPDDLIVYCGHDYGIQQKDSLGNQKRTNPYLLIDDKAFFINFRLNLQSQYRQMPFAPSSYEEIQTIRSKHESIE